MVEVGPSTRAKPSEDKWTCNGPSTPVFDDTCSSKKLDQHFPETDSTRKAIQTDLAHRAGLTASTGAETGVVTLIQRFGSALNLHIHLHMLNLDGVYTLEQNVPRFHRVGAPNRQALDRLLKRLVQRIVRRLTHDGLLIEDPEQPWLDLEPTDTLDHLNAASIRYRIAVGQGAGGRTLTLKNPALTRTDATPKPFTANQDGFSPNCAVACQAHQRDRLERRCRYMTRSALCLERLSTNRAGSLQAGAAHSRWQE